jgi:hypothetical protein
MGSESGYASIQQQCMSCHGHENMPRARPIAALRDLSPEQVLESITSPSIRSVRWKREFQITCGPLDELIANV